MQNGFTCAVEFAIIQSRMEPTSDPQPPKSNKPSPVRWMVLLVAALAIITLMLLYAFRDVLPFGIAFLLSPTPGQTAVLASPSQTAVVAGSTPSPTTLATFTATLGPSPSPDQPTNTVTAFPTATFTATLEGTQMSPTPSATARWYLRGNTPTPRPTYTPTKTRTPTITLTPTPRDHALRIDSPGPLSKEVSPLWVDAAIAPGADGTALLELIGEDGRLITSMSVYGGEDRLFQIQRSLEFSIPGAGELARLLVSVRDAYGRITSLSSVDVVLLQMGDDERNPAVFTLDPYIVWEPQKNSVVSGGVLWLNGLAYGVNENPLIIEMITTSGEVVASKQITLPAVKEGHTHARFDVGVPYTVDTQTPVLLVLRQESDNRIAGTVFLSSVPITLEP